MAGKPDEVDLLAWGEYSCPWSYIVTARLRRVIREYGGRLRLRIKPFPVELTSGEAAPRDTLTLEWWLAAVQEPDAPFVVFRGSDWPTTTLPAFEAAWCATQEGTAAGLDYDFRVRRAFFAEGRNIGRRSELLDIAYEAGLDVKLFRARWDSGAARAAVLADAADGRTRYKIRQTPALMLADGTPITLPLAVPRVRNRHIVAMSPLPCVGHGCDGEMRRTIERALTARGPAE